jgi:hypothetical protein
MLRKENNQGFNKVEPKKPVLNNSNIKKTETKCILNK